MKTLLAWIGFTDIRQAKAKHASDLGPIGQALVKGEFGRVALITDAIEEDRLAVDDYLRSLARDEIEIEMRVVHLNSPIDFQEIYPIANSVLQDMLQREPAENVTLHFNPGTGVMQTTWVLLAATTGVKVIQTSREHGLEAADIPFDVLQDYVPELVKRQSKRITKAITEPAEVEPGFAGILHQSEAISAVIRDAEKIASFEIDVLIEGESGTGKELFAKGIHEASNRRDGPFIVINCGGITESLIDSELFGYEKGAFTGADKARAGKFELASGGTLFLDEVGELPHAAQTRLLRVLQDKKIVRVGPGAEEIEVDVRVVSATNRDLIEEIKKENFRLDLYFRLAPTSIHIPALRERHGDIEFLRDKLFARKSEDVGRSNKKLTESAKKHLLRHTWPGNVRELEWTLARAIVLSSGNEISGADIDRCIKVIDTTTDELFDRPLGGNFDLDGVTAEFEARYVRKALDQSDGKITPASRLLGISQQTLSNRINKRLSQFLTK
jgi:transcriptional regulator with PAS, ATPase and Fis domain